MSVTDEGLRNNERYEAKFDKGDLPLPPAWKLAVVACMDARLDVHKILGLDEGEAHVICNACGIVVGDEIRSPAISQRLLGRGSRSGLGALGRILDASPERSSPVLWRDFRLCVRRRGFRPRAGWPAARAGSSSADRRHMRGCRRS
jgi:hypothetical protein